MSLVWASSVLLFVLLFLNTLSGEMENIPRLSRREAAETLLGLALTYVIAPVIMTALASRVLQDRDFLIGFTISTMAPAALVAPFFARARGGDRRAALAGVVTTTLACPFALALFLPRLIPDNMYINTSYTVTYMAALTILPVLTSWIATRACPRLPVFLEPAMPTANSVILAALMFILVGSSLHKVPLHSLAIRDLMALAGLYLVFDFGIYILGRRAFGLFFTPSTAEALALNLSTRNFAVTAGLMLFFQPKAAVPSAVGLVIHGLFFQFLLWPQRLRPARPQAGGEEIRRNASGNPERGRAGAGAIFEQHGLRRDS